MSEEFIANAIANIGVPTAMCFYCLFALNKAVNRLADKVDKISDKVERFFIQVSQLIESVRSLENDLRRRQ
ncbi:MAG: hypothetical protein IKI76_03155 [Selenomonadaceae bacterium]|nr:hypothetical protein [Selenomonadaceae bacterium]